MTWKFELAQTSSVLKRITCKSIQPNMYRQIHTCILTATHICIYIHKQIREINDWDYSNKQLSKPHFIKFFNDEPSLEGDKDPWKDIYIYTYIYKSQGLLILAAQNEDRVAQIMFGFVFLKLVSLSLICHHSHLPHPNPPLLLSSRLLAAAVTAQREWQKLGKHCWQIQGIIIRCKKIVLDHW